MPNYLVELEDGRKFQVEADSPPTSDDLTQYFAAQSAPQAQAAKKDLPFGDITDVASALGQAASSSLTTVPASFRQMYEGSMNPWEKSAESLESRKAMQRVAQESEAAQAEAEASGDASVMGRAIRSGIPSYGFTGAILPVSVAAGGVAGLGTGLVSKNPVAAQRAAMAAGSAASGVASYRMAASQFMDDARERIDNFFLEKAGRLPNKQEQDEAYQELLPLAQEMGMSEALPEAFGNLALAGAGKYIYRILGGKTGVQQLASGALSKARGLNAAKALGAGAASTGVEVGTEGLTEMLNEDTMKKLEEGVMRGEDVSTVQTEPYSMKRLGESIEKVAEPTLATTAIVGLLGAGGGMAYRAATKQNLTESDFRNKMEKQLQASQIGLADPEATAANKSIYGEKAEEAAAALKALDEGRTSDVEKFFNVRFKPSETIAEEPSMLDPVEVAVDLSDASVQTLADTGNDASAIAQDDFAKTAAELLETPDTSGYSEETGSPPTPGANPAGAGDRVTLPNRSIYRGRKATIESVDKSGFANVTTEDGEKMIVRLDEVTPESTNARVATPNPPTIDNADELVKNGGGTVQVSQNGRKVSYDKFALVIDGNTAEVAFVELSPSERGKGIGLSAYEQLGRELAARGITLQSSKAQYGDGRKMWQKLASKGLAKLGAQGVFSFTLPTDVRGKVEDVSADEVEVTPSLPETEMQSVVDQEAPAGTPVQAAPIQPVETQEAPQRILTAQEEFLASKGVTDTDKLPQRRRQALEKEYQKWLKERGGAFRITLPEQRGGGNLILSDWKQAYPLLPEDLKTDLLRVVVNNRGRTATEQDVTDVMAFAEELVSQRPADERVFNESNLFYDISANRNATPEIKARAQRRYEEAQGLPSPPTKGAEPTTATEGGSANIQPLTTPPNKRKVEDMKDILDTGKSSGQRDTSKPEFKPKEQQSPDEYLADFSYDIALARAERDNTGESLKALKKEGRVAYDKRIRESLRQSHVDAIKIASGLDEASNQDFAKYGMSIPRTPVSKAAVDAYKITLPAGYVQDGELYVFSPQTKESETETAATEGMLTPGGVASPAVEAAPEPAPKAQPEQPATKEKAPTEPSESTLSIAKRFGGRIAWSQGDLAIIEGFQLFGSKSLYVAVVGDRYSLTDFTLMKPEQRKALLGDNEELFLRKREELVEANNRMLAQNPDGPFTNEQTIVVSKNVPQNVASVFREWVRLLGLNAPTRIILTTPQDGIDMAAEYGGKFRRIGVTSLMSDNERGQMTPLGEDDFHIFYKEDTSYARTLEVLAHELGHILERQSFKNLPEDQRKAIIAEHEKWLKRVGSQKALDGIRELRAMRVGRIQPNVDRADERFEELNSYWKSFSEWFADQVSRWATTTDKPLTVIEKFFARLGKKLREFFNLKGSQFAPNQRIADWLNSLSPDLNAVVEETLAPAEPATKDSLPVVRDTSKPEQMTPEEASAQIRVERLKGATILRWKDESGKGRQVQMAVRSDLALKTFHQSEVNRAFRTNQPVSAAAVDAYGITLPEGYVRQGDLYVYNPQTTTVATQTETAPSSAKEGAVASVGSNLARGRSSELPASKTPESQEMDRFVKSLTDDQFNELIDSEAFDVDPKIKIKSQDTFDAKQIKRRKFVDQVNATASQKRKTAEQIFKEEEAALERQRKLDERLRQSLNSIIDKEKTNIVQGTVSKADAEFARRTLNNSGEIPNAFLTRVYASPEEFLADKGNQRLFPSSYSRLQSESNIEGLFERGQTLIFADKIGVSDLDRRIGKNLGISPQQAAARRVIAHENGHRGVALFTASEKRELLGYLRRKYNDAQIDNLVRVYTEYADWRTNLESRNEALEELFLKDFERLEKIPTGGIWDDIVEFLKRVWRRLTGRKGDPTLQDMKDVVRLLRNAMRRTAVPSFTTKDGGEVKLSLSDRFQGVTPEQDAEYLAAVEAGDMETAQRMVDEAAKAAGYDVGPVYHGTAPSSWSWDEGLKLFGVFGKDWTAFNGPAYFASNKTYADAFAKHRSGERSLGNEPITLSVMLSGKFKDMRGTDGFWKELRSNPKNLIASASSEGFTGFLLTEADTSKRPEWAGDIYFVFDPNQIKSADPVTRDESGNVIPLSQRFQTASPDIRFSRVEYASDYQAAVSAGAQLARDTVYDDRIIEMRDAIRRAYEQSSTEAGVAMPIDELYAKANAITPMSESDFGNILQDLYEDNGAVLQDGATQISGEPLASTQNLEKDNPFNELIRKSSSKSPSIGEINSVSKKFITRFIRPDSSFARQNDIRIDGNATLQARALPDGGIVIGYSLSQDSFDGLQKMAPQAASQYTKDAAIEELIHLSDLIGLRNQWLKSGKQIPFDQFVLNEQSNLAFSLIQQADSMSDSEAESLRKILASSLSLYDNNADIAKLGLNELLDLAAQNSFVLPELIRSLIQLKKTGQITETAFRKIANVLRQWQETVLQWLVDGYSSARDGVFGEMLSERIKNAEANLEILSGNTFDVFTPEGRRAGFAVIMPKRAVASRVETEGPAFDAYRKTVEAINENSLNAFSKARPMKGASPQVHTVKSSKSYEQAAIELVNDLAKDGTPIEDIAESLFSDEFLQGLGIKLDIPALVSLIAEVKNRVSNQSRDDKIPGARRVKLQKLDRKLAGYWQDLGTNSGRSQGIRSYITRNPRYRWMFIFDKAEEQLRKDRELAATRVASDLPQTAENLQKTDAKIAEETDEQVADDVEQFAESEDDTLLREGETALDSGRRSIWERMKDVLRKLALVARARKGRAANAAKASISKEERDAISQMSDAELAKMESDLLSEFDRLSEAFLKGGTEQQKATRKKMVATAKKRAEQGKPIEVTSVNTADVIDGIFVGFNDRDSIINEVGDALLKAAEQRKVKPKQKTAIQDLIAAIRQTLTANLKGEQIKADQPSLGKLLGKTFAQQGSEAALFAKSWEDGRKKVRAMLADMGVDEASLDEELDAIMPPTPTLAYAPAAAKKAINVAIKEAGLTPQDALSNPAFFRESIMAKFNEAAEKDNLTEEGWNQSGKALAEKAINEFIDNARIKAEKRSAESKAKMEKRKVEIADKRASQLIYSVEERFRQGSKDLQTSKSGDSINKAFRDQVKDPVSKFEFFQRLAKLNVSQDVSERLFRTAAREKADLKAMEAFRRLEGPNALQTMLREISALRPGEQAPLSKQIPWRKLLSQKASTVEIYRQRIFDAISSEESLANLDDAQKAKLADLFTQAWESKRKAILDRMVDNAISQEQAAGRLTKEGADALRSQRQKLVEDINLGILDEDRLMKHLADKFGIKSEFTEAERANIDRLLDILQDDKLNEVKRNKAAYELLEALSSATKIPIAKLLADYWVSSVLSGVNTAASIAMAVMSGGYELTTGAFRILRAGFTNPKELPAEIAASFKAIAEFLKAFGREGRLAWQYLVTGDRAFLDPSMNTVLNDLNYDSIGKTVSLAEKMAKSDKLTEKVMGIWMRSVSRLLTALDSFNSGVTKAGALPIVFRQLDLSAEALKQATEKYNLQLYRDKVIQRDFNGNKPTTAHDKALVDSYAKAEMMADLQEFGKFSENADFFGQQGAMTFDPTGFGGFFYSSIKSLTGGATNRADKFLAEAEREWKQADGADKTAKGLQLAFAYFLQFGAYNSANLAGLRFARFAGNKFNQGLSFIPGIGMFRMYEATVKDSKIEAKEAFTDMILRNQTAGLLFAIIGGMALKAITDEPDDEKRGWFINGGWANLTPDRKQQKLAAGQKEFTIGIGGKVYNYQNWPISPILAAIGSLSDLIRFSPEQWNEKSVIGRLGSAAASGVFSAGEIPALSGFQTLFGNNLSSKDPNEKRLDRFAKVMAGWGGGFVPRILKDIDFMADPGLRKYETLWEQTASHIPVYRRYSGEEYYDILGKQIERKVWPGSREFMELESAPEYRTLGKLNSRGIWLTPANAEHRMVGKGRNKRKLTQEEADAYSLETGKGYRQMLLRYGSRLEQMPTERARAFLMDKADEVRDRALKKIVR